MRLRHQFKSGRQFERFIAVRHPHRQFFCEPLKQNRFRDNIDFRAAILALVRGAHLAAQRVHHELQSVADAEHGHAQLKHARVRGRSVFVINRPGRAREHDARRRIAFHFVELRRARQHDRKHILLANAARDQLRILRAEVKDDNALAHRRRGRGS